MVVIGGGSGGGSTVPVGRVVVSVSRVVVSVSRGGGSVGATLAESMDAVGDGAASLDGAYQDGQHDHVSNSRRGVEDLRAWDQA